ncbi:MAG: hypothetical protein DRQ08_03630 [Candidatus Latescibacterota bacterium]|nr:MAG: hypothetical protein DRQ08_03630 [Candidatus Latescibacterota bacterium]
MAKVDAVGKVKEALRTSEFLKAIAEVKKDPQAYALDGVRVLPLTQEQISRLERNGNSAEDWSKVKVAEGFDPDRVRNCRFLGKVALGRFQGTISLGGAELPSGVYDSVIADSYIGNDALVQDVKLLSRYVVRSEAAVVGCGTVFTEPGTSFGNGEELPIAIETGGREVLTYAEMDVDVAETVASSRGDKELLSAYEEAVGEYVEKARSDYGVIEKGAKVLNTGRVEGVYVGPYAVIDNARTVKNVTILSNEDESVEISDGAYVVSSIVQWGCEVTSMAIVDTSVLTEHSHVERHGKVTESLIGPNTGVAEGEVTASLLGPFVGFHHQALLIAAFWPEGKGNVAYGANIGSNHTSRAPDQEIWPGEGTFFGLGVNIKFPSNFTEAPYSIFATGVTALPQRISFPFSLINTPAVVYPGISPGYNEIVPAYVLRDNLFALKRNEGKFKARNKARRTKFVFSVFRKDIVDLMINARRLLQDVKEIKEIYTEADIPGLGKNYMLEGSRVHAIETYTFYIRYYALLGLKEQIEKSLAEGRDVSDILDVPSEDPQWEHRRRILAQEFPGMGIHDLLKMLKDMQEKVARDVEESKRKDDKRGQCIIPDYAEVHIPAEDDKFVRQTWDETIKLQKEIDRILEKLGR